MPEYCIFTTIYHTNQVTMPARPSPGLRREAGLFDYRWPLGTLWDRIPDHRVRVECAVGDVLALQCLLSSMVPSD